MTTDIKAYKLFQEFYNSNSNFRELVNNGILNNTIRFFGEDEWNKINSQNFVPPIAEIGSFFELFTHGYNIGNCVGTCKQLSYSYDDVNIVSGILPILKGTKNAELEGGHCWLETEHTIIDTSLMLVIDLSLKEQFGYIEEQRITSEQLANSPLYQARKTFTNDQNIKRSLKKLEQES